MIQFTQQYIRDYFKPFLQKVLTDMSTTTDKGNPLYKIKHQIQITAGDREEFEKKYFLGQQPAKRPFTGQDEGEYRKYFIEELTSHVNTMIRLSNVRGMQEALLPDEAAGRTFGTHQKLTENLNRLSIKLARNFEKRKINEKLTEEGTLTKEKQEQIENGEMKFVEIDGKEEVKTEEEIKEMARKEPQKTIVPSIQPEIEKTFDTSFQGEDSSQEIPKVQEKKAETVTKIKDDFDTAKRASVREALLASGLEVIGTMKIENSRVTGTVRDVEGQELKVFVDTRKPNYAANKFIFIFTANGPHPELEGERIPVSQDDLPSTFVGEEGKRKPAEKVFKEQDAYGTMAKGKYQPPPKSSARPTLPSSIKLPERQGRGAIPLQTPEQSIVAKQKIPTRTGGVYSVKVGVTGGGQARGSIEGTAPEKQQIRKTVKSAKIKGPQPTPQPTPKSIMEKKREREERQAALESQQQRKAPQSKQPNTPQSTPIPQPQKKKGMPGLAKLAIGTGTGVGVGTIGLAHWVATSDSRAAELAIKVVLSCLGINCLA